MASHTAKKKKKKEKENQLRTKKKTRGNAKIKNGIQRWKKKRWWGYLQVISTDSALCILILLVLVERERERKKKEALGEVFFVVLVELG